MRLLLRPFESELPIRDFTTNLINFGIQEKDPSQKLGPYTKPEYTLQYVTEGKGYYEIAGKKYTVKKGDMFCLFKNKMLSYKSDNLEPYTYYWIGFDGSNTKILLNLMGFTEEHPIVHYLDDKIIEIFQKITNSLLKETFSSLVKAQGYLYELFSLLLSYKKENISTLNKSSYRIISNALDFIKNNYNDNITISQIAKQVGLCRSHFCVQFNKYVGVSPMEYLMNYRISKAQILLRQKLPVTEVAINCGFSSISNFSVQFKKVIGISPKEYKLYGL